MAIYNFVDNVAQTIKLGRRRSIEIKGVFDGATITLTLPGGTTVIRTPTTAAEVFECGAHDIIITPTSGGASMDIDVIVLSVDENANYPS